MAEKIWILHALPNEDSVVLEVFSYEEGPPTDKYIQEMYGAGFLYEYDLVRKDGSDQATNGFPCPPKGFDI